MAISKIGTNSLGNVTDVSSSTTLSLKTADTTRMTIDVNGNVNVDAGTLYVDAANNRVGVGTSTPTARLQANVTSAGSNTTPLVISNTSATTSTECSIGFSPYIDTSVITGSVSLLNQGSGAYALKFSNWNGSANTERMRIDSSGNVLVGTTNTSVTAGAGLKLLYDGTGSNSQFSAVGSASTNTTFNYWLYSTGAAAFRFYVGLGGTVYATSTTITGISDQRLKENIIDLDDGLDAVMALKPRKFDWKEGKGKNVKGDRGFIAQEFEQVFPDMVEEWADKAPEGEEPYKAVNANLIPTLVKAIQEQQELIKQLQADVAKLKGAKA